MFIILINSDIINGATFVYSLYAEESFADIHKVDGLRGVYIASTLTNRRQNAQSSFITFNKGALWSRLRPPARDIDGNNITCLFNLV